MNEPTEDANEADLAAADSSKRPSVKLSELVANRVRGGASAISFEDAKAGPASFSPGKTVMLADAEEHGIAFGIWDTDNKCIRVWPFWDNESEPEFDAKFVRRRIDRALAWRKKLDLVDDDSAYRLINGEGDGLAGYTVDVYAGHAIIFTYSDKLQASTTLVASALQRAIKPHSMICKLRPPGETPVGRVEFQSLSEEAPPKAITVIEDDIKYEVHLQGGINTGLFCDMRDVRRAVGFLAPGRRVLNLFAYTGSFSVVSALADAKSVTTVEFASGVIEWCKSNFTLNELSPTDKRWKFVKADVFEFLKTARRKNDLWDLVILDPPGTTAFPGKKWSMKSDYHRLIAQAIRVLAPDGILVVAANTLQSRPEGIEKHIREAARVTGRRFRLIDSFGLPGDFPTQMIHPESRYLKVFFLLSE